MPAATEPRRFADDICGDRHYVTGFGEWNLPRLDSAA
jgi:hypothetical protein